MWRVNAPWLSVAVTYCLPVNVFFAVTLTPGSGVWPDLMIPDTVPPATADGAGATGGAGGTCGAWLAAGGCVAGVDCGHAHNGTVPSSAANALSRFIGTPTRHRAMVHVPSNRKP